MAGKNRLAHEVTCSIQGNSAAISRANRGMNAAYTEKWNFGVPTFQFVHEAFYIDFDKDESGETRERNLELEIDVFKEMGSPFATLSYRGVEFGKVQIGWSQRRNSSGPYMQWGPVFVEENPKGQAMFCHNNPFGRTGAPNQTLRSFVKVVTMVIDWPTLIKSSIVSELKSNGVEEVSIYGNTFSVDDKCLTATDLAAFMDARALIGGIKQLGDDSVMENGTEVPIDEASFDSVKRHLVEVLNGGGISKISISTCNGEQQVDLRDSRVLPKQLWLATGGSMPERKFVSDIVFHGRTYDPNNPERRNRPLFSDI